MQHGLQAATLDPLTGLHNRRYALARLAEMSNTIRDDVAVMVVDLDHFKSVNDTYGHAGGDAALKQVAKRLREQLRTDDLLARIGGEEFLVALPGCDRTRANLVAKELCAAVRDTPIRLHRRARPFHVTVSIGLACGTSRGLSGGDLLMLADQALYRSKSEGRDTVRLSQISAA
jgi:two-component system cell cycle response regulator